MCCCLARRQEDQSSNILERMNGVSSSWASFVSVARAVGAGSVYSQSRFPWSPISSRLVPQ